MNKMTHVILCNGSVLGKVYVHPDFGRTIVFTSNIQMDDIITIWRMNDDGNHERVVEKYALDFFRDFLPV